MTAELEPSKAMVRRLIGKLLASMSAESRLEKSSKAIVKLKGLREFSTARCVMTYVSKQDEVDTTWLIADMLRSGKRVVVPVVDRRMGELVPCEIFSPEELRAGTFGVMEPECVRPVAVEDIDLIVVPGRAFDRHCNRLGRSKGYFDRFLRRLSGKRRTVGLAFSEQVLDRIPIDKNDVKVDVVVTDSFVIKA